MKGFPGLSSKALKIYMCVYAGTHAHTYLYVCKYPFEQIHLERFITIFL